MGGQCCETKRNLNDNIYNKNKFPNSTNSERNTIKNISLKEEINNGLEATNINEKEKIVGITVEDPTLEYSNIDRHASIGSSIRFDSSQDIIEQNSIIKNSDRGNIYDNNLNQNDGSINLGEKLNPTNSINDYNNNNENYKNINKNSKEDILPLECINSFEAHQEKIVSLIELKSGKIATGSYDNTIKIWNVDNLECEKTINEGGCVLCLLEFEENMILSGTNESTIQLWDINDSLKS